MDLNQLSPEQIESLRRLLGVTTTTLPGGRTAEFRQRQLHNLNLQPTATDARPMFVWSAEGDRNHIPGSGTPYPKLLWHQETNQEITVYDADEQERKIEEGFGLLPISLTAPTPTELLAEDLAGLTEAERAQVLSEQKTQRLGSIRDRLASLSESELEALLNRAAQPKKRVRKTA